MNLPTRWSKIKIRKDVTNKDFGRAERIAKKHEKGKLKSLSFTESNPEWVLLYEHAKIGQIHPDVMKFMCRRDLRFLAGHVFPHPALTQPPTDVEKDYDPRTSPSPSIIVPLPPDISTEEKWSQVTKLQGNAARAKMELERRNTIWLITFTTMGAIVGGLISGELVDKIF